MKNTDINGANEVMDQTSPNHQITKSPNRVYWKGLEELHGDAEFVRHRNNEFIEHLPLDEIVTEKSEDVTVTPRRDFLKFLGFSVAAASLAACEAPVRKTIPYLVKPEQVTPGVANFYASTYFDGYDYCPIVVKTREGRPIKIEGNTLSGITKGGTNARVQASLLSLYDNGRLKNATINGNPAKWETVDKEVIEKLSSIAASGGKIRILSSTIISPSTLNVIGDFTKKYPTAKHVVYDAVSASAMRTANEQSFGSAVVPSYNFNNASVIAAFDCDFLVNWVSPIEHAWQYGQTRKLDNGKKEMSKHYQFESALSVTGSNADKRVGVKPSQQGAALTYLYNAIAKRSAGSILNASEVGALAKELDELADMLVKNQGKSLVVCGINNVAIQNLVNGINSMLGSYGSTIDLSKASNLRQGNDADVAALVDEVNKGEVQALLIYNSNPVYTLPNGAAFANALKKIPVSVSFADRADETAALCKYVCPDNHPFESWNDAEPKKGMYSFTQPTINPLFATRQFQETILVWSGNAMNYHDYLAQQWKGKGDWNKMLQDGVSDPVTATTDESSPAMSTTGGGRTQASGIAKEVPSASSNGFELVIYEKTGLGSGVQANNPWLQELPDPVSKVTWDNYLAVSPKDAREKSWVQGNVVEIKANGVSAKVPVFVQPGQMPGTVSLALGYGRTAAGKVANGVGVNAYPMVSMVDGTMQYSAGNVTVNKTVDADYVLAATQTHHTMMGRAIAKETTLEEYIKTPNAGNEIEEFHVRVGQTEVKKPASKVNLWDNFSVGNHHFGMAIDLNSCIGCGSCVVACNVENNVPIVGKEEVSRSREMHWIRIDRYFSSDADPVGHHEKGDIKKMEVPSDMPQVLFQPVMCQHCSHAPCETVCPVIATTHSSEGYNQMIYNRCVGTRYCANNCPYKVRRFNWFRYSDNTKFDFHMNNDLGKMVLNPDVTVRARGVMEKCSMCVQRLQEAKLNVKREGRPMKDGEVITACAQACPTQAITFGDYNIKDSRINKMMNFEERSYHLLEEIDTQPNVFYQTKVRNVEPEVHHETHSKEPHQGGVLSSSKEGVTQ